MAEKLSRIQCTYLVAGGAARSNLFGIVSLAVHRAILVAVAQVDEQFLACGADEARRMPAEVLAGLRCEHCHLIRLDLPLAVMAHLW